MNPEGLYKRHQDAILISLEAFFLALIVGVFAWGMWAIILNFNTGVATSKEQPNPVGFKIDAAKTILGSRGLIQKSL